MAVTLELSVCVGGLMWHLYSCSYKGDDGTFEFYFYAISDEHADAVVADIKDSAVVQGRVVKRV